MSSPAHRERDTASRRIGTVLLACAAVALGAWAVRAPATGPSRSSSERPPAAAAPTRAPSSAPAAEGIDIDAVRATLRAAAPEVSRCIEGRGGATALRGTSDGSARAPRLAFVIEADGTVDPSSITIAPAIDPAMAECFSVALLGLRFAGPSAREARIAVPLDLLVRLAPDTNAPNPGAAPR